MEGSESLAQECVILWTVILQTPLFMDFSQQEY